MADVLKDGQTGPLEGPGDSFAVECLPVVMRQIQAEVIEAFYSTPRGGVEIGGVLYGARESGRIVILLARTLGCEHASGPSFVLSTNEHARLAALLEAPQHDRNLAGMRVLGWYHSHTRSELELTPQDLELHDRYFPEPGQVALVLRPGTMRPMRTCFYYRGTDGVLHSYKPYPESETSARMAVPRSLDGPCLRGLLRDTQPHARMAAPRPLEVLPELHPTPRPPVVRESGAQAAAKAPLLSDVRESSAQAAAKAPPLSDLPRFLAVEAPPRRRWTIWASVAVAACLLAGGAEYVIRTHGTRTPAAEPTSGLRLQVSDQKGELKVRWNGTLPAVQDAQAGSLEFLDGSARRVFQLDPQMLRSGSLNYVRNSDMVGIHLTVDKPDGSRLEELCFFLGQTPPGSPAGPQPELARQRAGEEAAAAERRRAETEKTDVQKGERERELEQMRLAAQKKTQPIPSALVQATPGTAPQTASPLLPKPVTRTTGAEKPPAPTRAAPAVVARQATPAAEPTSKARQPEVAAGKPAPPVSQPASRTSPPPQIASQPPAQTSKPVLAAKVEPEVMKPPAQTSMPVPAAKVEPEVVKPPAQTSMPVPAAKVEPAVVKPPAVAAKPPAARLAPLSGEWILAPSAPSGSPFRPDSVTLSLSEDGNWMRGTLVGRYRTSKSSGLKRDVSFAFGGSLRSGTMKLPWSAPDGAKGEIEFIRLPNNSESLEVVWYSADRKFVFDDVVVRVKKK